MSAINAMHSAMDYHLSRHNLLSANLAQVDTPGYKPRELYRTSSPEDGSFRAHLAERLAITDQRHLPVGAGEQRWQVGVDRFSPVKPDGNGVSLDREVVKIAANNLRYDTLSTLVSSSFGMVQFAAQDGR